MALEKGQRLGPYEIEKPLGAGGMGEVYKARDTRLDRTVAIKVLPERTALNADLRARFEREAKAISSLNHPHICTLYDVGRQDRTDYLVMEYLEGESLSDRLKRGAMDADEVLDTATQIADALETAHRQGLIHRDLKPDNVFLTEEGAKLLDFGLAKVQISDGLVEGFSGVTQTSPLTGRGTIVGTLLYISPEQLEGHEADPRSDIFAFGATLYEMVTGKRAFEGKSQAGLVAAVLERDPMPISEIKPLTPPALTRLIRRCLAKDPDKRWQSATDLADELRWIAQSGSQAGVPASLSIRRRFHFKLLWIMAAIAVCTTAFLLTLLLTQEKVERRVVRFTMPLIPEAATVQWPRISPDGRMLAFRVADSTGQYQIWIRPLNSFDANPLPGTEGANRPFWSPDSRFLAFFTGDQLKKVSASGGPVQLICEAVNGADGSWGTDGVILFDGNIADSIRMVSASGGVPTGATVIDRTAGETSHTWPWFLPDGRHFLFVVNSDSIENPASKGLLRVGSLGSTEVKELGTVESRAEFCEPGYILYMKGGFLVAHRFDVDALEFSGEPILLTDNIRETGGTHLGVDFSVSENGTLVAQKGTTSEPHLLVWYDRNGLAYDTIGEPARYSGLALSPDDSRLAYVLVPPTTTTSDIWIRELDRGVSSRFTFEETFKFLPLWSPDGSRLAYTTFTGTHTEIRSQLLTGTGEPVVIYTPDSGIAAGVQWTASDQFLIVEASDATADVAQISLFSIDDAEDVRKLVSGPFTQIPSGLSPDERFLLYTSDETGRNEVYVRDLHASGRKWQISPDGGYLPQWRSDGREIFYLKGRDLFVVPVTTAQGFQPGTPELLFGLRHAGSSENLSGYTVSQDGQRFLFITRAVLRVTDAESIEIVLNWDAELED